MSKHLIKIDTPQHVAMSVVHEGKDKQYAEAGETVAIDWQPSSGWGLQEAHYIDEDGNIVPIDLTTREFTMPAKAITISGTAKRFVIQDWTQGTATTPDPESIQPNVVTDFGELTANTTFGMAADMSGNGHYFWTFDTGAATPTITWPSDIVAWLGGSAPTIKANKHYSVSVLNGYAICAEF